MVVVVVYLFLFVVLGGGCRLVVESAITGCRP